MQTTTTLQSVKLYIYIGERESREGLDARWSSPEKRRRRQRSASKQAKGRERESGGSSRQEIPRPLQIPVAGIPAAAVRILGSPPPFLLSVYIYNRAIHIYTPTPGVHKQCDAFLPSVCSGIFVSHSSKKKSIYSLCSGDYKAIMNIDPKRSKRDFEVIRRRRNAYYIHRGMHTNVQGRRV